MEHFWRRTISRKYYSHFQLYMDRSNAVKIPSRIFLVSINSPNDSTKSPNKNPSNDRPIIYHRKYFPYHTDLPHPRIRSNIVMRSRGQRRFPGIVITTFKRRRVELGWMGPIVPLSIRPSFIRFMFYECTPRVMFMGNVVWPLSAFNPLRSLFLLAFYFYFYYYYRTLSPKRSTFRNVFRSILIPVFYFIYLFFFLSFFFYRFCITASPEGIIVNEGGVSCSKASSRRNSEEQSLKSWREDSNHLTHFSVWSTILKLFPRIFSQLSGEIFNNNNLVKCLREKFGIFQFAFDF